MLKLQNHKIFTLGLLSLSVAACGTAHHAPADIVGINNAINKSMAYKAEPKGQQVWQYNTPTGDCEDYALTKAVALHMAGYKPRLHFCEVEDGQAHAITAVDSGGFTYYLDNRHNHVTLKPQCRPLKGKK